MVVFVWGRGGGSDLEHKRGFHTQAGGLVPPIVCFYGTITEGNRTHIVQVQQKKNKRVAEGEIRPPSEMPFIF